jgi:hypothetical protein
MVSFTMSISPCQTTGSDHVLTYHKGHAQLITQLAMLFTGPMVVYQTLFLGQIQIASTNASTPSVLIQLGSCLTTSLPSQTA